jgi:hypothetical protein
MTKTLESRFPESGFRAFRYSRRPVFHKMKLPRLPPGTAIRKINGQGIVDRDSLIIRACLFFLEYYRLHTLPLS